MAREFDWEEIREKRRERRRAEGATEEQIAAEEIPADLVVWAPGSAGHKKRKKSNPKPRKDGQRWNTGSREAANAAGKVNGPPKGTFIPSPRNTKDPINERRILECHRNGLDTPTTARFTGLSPDTVMRYLRNNGLTPRPGKPGNPTGRNGKGDG